MGEWSASGGQAPPWSERVRVRGLVWRGIAWGASVGLMFAVLVVGMIGVAADASPASPGSLDWFRARLWGIGLVAPIGTLLGAVLGLVVGPFVADAATRAGVSLDEHGKASTTRVARSCGVVAAGVTAVVLLIVLLYVGILDARPLAHIAWVPGAAGLAAVAGLLAAYEAPRAASRSGVLVDAPPTRRWLLGAGLGALTVTLLVLRFTVLPPA